MAAAGTVESNVNQTEKNIVKTARLIVFKFIYRIIFNVGDLESGFE